MQGGSWCAWRARHCTILTCMPYPKPVNPHAPASTMTAHQPNPCWSCAPPSSETIRQVTCTLSRLGLNREVYVVGREVKVRAALRQHRERFCLPQHLPHLDPVLQEGHLLRQTLEESGDALGLGGSCHLRLRLFVHALDLQKAFVQVQSNSLEIIGDRQSSSNKNHQLMTTAGSF